MKKKFLVTLLVIALTLVVSSLASADYSVVSYSDITNNHNVNGVIPTSYVVNGDFNGEWTSTGPTGWEIWANTKGGWDNAHFANINMAQSSDGISNALGIHIRNSGGSGSYYAGAKQQLNLITTAGYYFVNVSENIWYNSDRETAAYNSMAWYAISSSSDPSAVTEWRELDPYVYQCPSDLQVCIYVGRDETVWIEPGQWLHLMVGHKFPVFNASTQFVLDDVSIVAVDPEAVTASYPTGYYDWVNDSPVDDKCHWWDEVCIGYTAVVHTWNRHAVR